MRAMTMIAPTIIPKATPEAESWAGAGLCGVLIMVVIFEYILC
jgi:hypothetical protein